MKVSIITIGDEILIGQIVNTNAQWLANKIAQTGAENVYQSSISDKKEAIFNELDKTISFSDIIIITGGLGPTVDDITKQTLADYFNTELVVHQETYDYLKAFFEKRNRPFTESNVAQAMVPKDCQIISNPVGTAPGMLFTKDNTYIFSLPGVPKEMKSISESFIFDFIKNKLDETESQVMLYKTLKTFGIFESHLAEKIGEFEFLNGNSLAFLPSSTKGVRLRISVKADNREIGVEELNRIKNELYSRVGEYIYGEDDDDMLSKVGELLKKNFLTVSVAESCTGGMLGASFTDVSGSSSYFKGGMITYDNEVKINQLGVNRKTIIDHGAVSEQCAAEMATQIKKILNTDVGISITGVAGPSGGTDEKPVGTVWIGFAFGETVKSIKYNFGKHRGFNRERAVSAAISILYNRLKVIK